MRYLKRQSTNRRLLRGKGVIYDQYENIEIQSTGALLMPKGTTAQRPTAVVGQLRYNTQTKSFEAYEDLQNGGATWKEFRLAEPVAITQQNLGNGNGVETTFGPLNSGDSFYPVPISENNILVTIENVFQLATTNYTLVQNPSSGPGAPYAAGWYLVFGTPVPTGKPVQVLHNFDK